MYKKTIDILTIIFFITVLIRTPGAFQSCTNSLAHKIYEKDTETISKISKINENIKNIKPHFFANNNIFFDKGFPKKSVFMNNWNKDVYKSNIVGFYNYVIERHTGNEIKFDFKGTPSVLISTYVSLVNYFGTGFENAFLTYILDNKTLEVSEIDHTIDEYLTADNASSVLNILKIKCEQLNFDTIKPIGSCIFTASLKAARDCLEECKTEWCNYTKIFSLHEHLTKYKEKQILIGGCTKRGECRSGYSSNNTLNKKTYLGFISNFFNFLWSLFYHAECIKITIFFICVSIRFTYNKLFFYFAPIPIVCFVLFREIDSFTLFTGICVWIFSIYSYHLKNYFTT